MDESTYRELVLTALSVQLRMTARLLQMIVSATVDMTAASNGIKASYKGLEAADTLLEASENA